MGLREFLLGKIGRKLILVFLIISLIPIILFGVILFSIIVPSAGRVVLDVDVGLEQVLHDSREIEVGLLTNSIEERLTEYLSLFQLTIFDKEFYEVLREAGDTGRISDNNFYPAEKSENWFYLNNQFKEAQKVMGNKIDMMRLFYKNGYIVNGVVLGEEDISDYKGDKSWFDKVMNPDIIFSDSYYISPISIARRTNTSAIRYVVPVERDGDRLGLFVVNFKSNVIAREIESFSLGESGIAMLIDLNYKNAEGEVSPWPVILSRSVEIGEAYLINESEVAQAPIGKMDLEDSFGEVCYIIENVTWHGHYKKVNFQDKEWYVVVSAPEKELFLLVRNVEDSIRAIQSRVWFFSILILILVIFLSVIFGIKTSKNFSKPIKILSEANEQIRFKNFKTRVDIKTGDELQELGETFNQTAEVLENIDKEYKQLEKAKTEFLSITSHELRSPMTPMKAQLQMLKGEYFGKLNDKQKGAIDIVERNTSRLDNIIVDFLEISRIEAARLKFRFEKKDLTFVINSLVREMEGFMPEKKVKISTKIGKLPVIEVDSDRVMQVLRNLINNAIRFCKVGCRIEVTAKLNNGWILFSVKDNGIGIRKEDQKRIFEPFFQAEQTIYREHPGTGLGLAIIRGIVESQEGKVWLESEVGKGTTFYFTVPLKPVRKAKAIKLLFSGQKNVEKQLKKVFVEVLGPLGEQEFEDLEKRGKLGDVDLSEYVDLLVKRGILRESDGKLFKDNLFELFEGEVMNKKVKLRGVK